eukprot:gene11946-5347_t
MSKEFMTENGSNFELRDIYNLKCNNSSDNIDRTIQNIKDSDATLIFTNSISTCQGTKDTISLAEKLKKDVLVITLYENTNINDEVEKVKNF